MKENNNLLTLDYSSGLKSACEWELVIHWKLNQIFPIDININYINIFFFTAIKMTPHRTENEN